MQLHIEAVTKQYATVTAVNQVSFQIDSGEIFALLGPNGAGKSSIIRMLVGMTKPDSGEIRIHWQDKTFNEVPRRLLGYLPEDRGLYGDKSIEKNLLFLAQLHGMSKADALQEMEHWLQVFELSERRHEDLKQLSKGNQQKVQLIAAVLHKPALVILDEPFSGLDPINQEKVVEFLKQLKQNGMTVLLSAHQMAMVEKLADRMVLMAKGEVVLAGSLADIRQQAKPEQQILLRSETPLPIEWLQALPEVSSLEQQAPGQALIRLKAEAQVAPVLRQLLERIEPEQIAMQTPDLHQLYLQAMAKHQSRVKLEVVA
ncbi:ATP-binding cassette domain-containing protein [Alkalimonas delamerensis]|uniref:ATP-binding cassette domain-containing protein n=1 Tax=Alkalimonas delamerensis TaxID=265981 RepID=A0ABT9GML7_9GAMM|nr:ATP-binding cassette domain-containing protein [Alkalimonas delamerensis]MDP4528208.1 ATP-binding cassette domain-containing protein [Alkalimonas delamerensis]